MLRLIALLSIVARCAAFGTFRASSGGGACIDVPVSEEERRDSFEEGASSRQEAGVENSAPKMHEVGGEAGCEDYHRRIAQLRELRKRVSSLD